MSIANSNADSEQSLETRYGKELTFSQFYDFLKLHKEHTFNSNIPHISCFCKICGNSSFFGKGLNDRKSIFREKFLTKPHDLVEKFSCNTDEGECMLEKCSLWKSSETLDDMKLDSSSDTDSSSENTYSSKYFPKNTEFFQGGLNKTYIELPWFFWV